MEITLLGTGAPEGTPAIGCSCETCRAARERGVERTRFSIHVRNERTDEALLIDASPDFRHQFTTHDVALPDAVVITHVHYDHHAGLGEVAQLYESLPLHAADGTGVVVPDPGAAAGSVADAVRDRYGYVSALSVSDHTPLRSFETCGLRVAFVPVEHGSTASYGLSVVDPNTDTKLSVTGDTTYGIDRGSRAALSDPDLLVVEAIAPASICETVPSDRIGGFDSPPSCSHEDREGTPRSMLSHTTREGALALAEEVDAARTRLVHASHYYPVSEAFEEPLATDGERHVI